MSPALIATFMFSTMMLMLLTGQRVFAAVGGVAALAALLLWGVGGSDLPFSGAMKLMKWYPLLTLPMFIFMGYVLSESKIADDLYKMFHVWMGPVPGGLAIGTIGLMVLISAMNGLSVAGMAIGATVALPELMKRRYDKRMVTGVIQAGSSLGILVPPSVVLVLYAMIARQPVGRLWLAGIIPGLVMAGMFMAYIYIRCKMNPALGPVLPKKDRAEYNRNLPLKINVLGGAIVAAILAVLWALGKGTIALPDTTFASIAFAVIVALIAGLLYVFRRRMIWNIEIPMAEKYHLLLAGLLPAAIFFSMMVPFVNGWTSLTESSALGALVAFMAAVVKGRMTRVVFENSVRKTLAISCMFMWIILAALGFGAVFDGLGAVRSIENLFTEQLGLSPWTILILMQLSFLLMGTFLDDTAMLVIVAPLYIPLVGQLGFDLIWYGVLYTITTQIAYMTPPFGYNLFLMRALAPKEITLRDIYGSIVPFVLVMVLALVTIMVFPNIAMWLPNYIYNR
ncbi:MAG: TRAP transporter large permease subunit [Pirellulaceae bacterium]